MRNYKSIFRTKFLSASVGMGDATNIGVIFLLAMKDMLLGIAQYIVLPVAVGASCIKTILAIQEAYRQGRHQHGPLMDAVAEIATTLGIVAAVVCAFVGGTLLHFVVPGLLTGAIGLKALYELGATCYYGYQYFKHRSNHAETAKKYYQKAKAHGVAFSVGLMTATAAAGLFFAHKATLGGLGIVAGAVGAGYSAYIGFRSIQEFRQEQREKEHLMMTTQDLNMSHDQSRELISNNARLHQLFPIQPVQSLPRLQTACLANSRENTDLEVFKSDRVINSGLGISKSKEHELCVSKLQRLKHNIHIRNQKM